MINRKLVSWVMIFALLLLAACGGSGGKSAEPSSAPSESASKASEAPAASSAAPAQKTTVDFWYLWGGTEGEYVEQLIQEFNESQDLYEVKGLSVPDVQKIIVAISSGNGPDVTDNFSNNTASYAEKGMLEPLDEYIDRDGYDVSDFVAAVLEGGRFNGKLYALPININFYMMFYNKQLLAEAGIDKVPSTASELLDAAIKTTKVNADKSIEMLGFPDFPFVYYTTNMSMALGGKFISDDGSTLTPDNPGTVAAIDLMRSYRERFGNNNVLKFVSSSKYLDATDPFVQGKQAFRFDGPWFGSTLKNALSVELDYGVAPMPGPDDQPELAGGGIVSSSTFFIPSNAKNKEGAWKFMSWLLSREGMTKFNSMFGNLPARTSVYDDPSLQGMPDFADFAKAATNPNLQTFPVFAGQTEYDKVIADEFELAVNGKQTAEEAVKNMKDKSANLLK